MKDQVTQINKNVKDLEFGACIKVVGTGGSGGNAIDHMINSGWCSSAFADDKVV